MASADDARSAALRDLRTLSTDELAAWMAEHGQPSFRAKQVAGWLEGAGVASFDEMTNVPKALREALASEFSLGGLAQTAVAESRDGSRKYVLACADGALVECVGMPSGRRLSACVSTQAGCGMACAFCATGREGLTRSLGAQEISDQAAHVARDFERRVTSVVLMGQGEPFANYDATIAAMRMMNSEEGLGIGARHITVSTCGVIPGIRRLSSEPEQFTLAVSLHTAVQRTRDVLMPGVKRWSLLRLHEALQDYVEATGRRPTYEYALMKGVNDTGEELRALCDFCEGTLCHVNIIPLNEVAGSAFLPSPASRAQEFVDRLAKVGVEATIRESRGADIDAACGQLKARLS